MSFGIVAAIVLAALAALAAAALLAHMIVVAPTRLRLTEIEAPIADLAAPLDGYTVVVLSDMHYGGTLAPAQLIRRAVRLAQGADPDLIVLLGDYGMSHRVLHALSRRLYEWALPKLAPALACLRARDGVVAVLGNHDHEYDADAIARWLTSLGVRVLVNECVCIERGGARLAVGGVDDFKQGEVDPYGGCAGVSADVPRVIISHNPDGVTALAPDARADLVLAGHTHGGQIVLPLLGAPMRHARVCGWHCASGWVPNPYAPLYVSTGVGSFLPLRLNCPPEVLMVRLRASGVTEAVRQSVSERVRQ
jgi:uncharacterized protein